MKRSTRPTLFAVFLCAIAGASPAAASAPSGDVFHHAFRPNERIVRTIVHTVQGPDGSTTFDGRSTMAVRSVNELEAQLSVHLTSRGGDPVDDTLRVDRRTLHVHDATGADTSANAVALYNVVLYGLPPGSLRVGQSWTTSIDSWVYGPPGKSTVRVVALDAARRMVRLSLSGRGSGLTGDDRAHPANLAVTITSGNTTARVRRTEGASVWSGSIELVDGIVRHEELEIKTTLTTPATALSPAHDDVQRAVLKTDLLEDRP